MARLFVPANSEYFSRAGAVVTGPPFTMACWFHTGNVADQLTLMELKQTNDRFVLELRGDVAGDPLRIAALNSGVNEEEVDSTTGYSANTWHHGIYVEVSASSRTVYLDGGNTASGTTSVTPTVDTTLIGRADIFGSDLFMDGRIAEAAFWNVALTQGEASALAAGVSPIRVRPAGLQGYWPLLALSGNAPDYSGKGKILTDNNTVGLADHAPMGPPFGFSLGWQGEFTAAAGGGPARRRVGIGAGQAMRR